jgi:hypothetical protein
VAGKRARFMVGVLLEGAKVLLIGHRARYLLAEEGT